MIIDELVAILGYDVRGEANLAKFNQGLDRAAARAQQVANRINAINVAIGTFVGQMAYGAITRLSAAIGSFPGQVIEVGKTFEALQIRLETLEGSAEKADAAMAWIRQFAKDTPLELAQVADAYADLKNFGIDPTNGSLQALTDAMSASGKGTAMLGRLTLALGQAWVKQKLQGQEILQLTEAGIPVWDMLAQATGKSVPELQKLSEAGKLGRKEIQLLQDAIGKKYVGASEKFAKSFEGITSKLGDEWTEFLRLVGAKGFYDDAKRRLEGVFETVRRLDREGTLDRIASGISSFLVGGLDIGGHIATQFGRIGGAIASVAGEITGLIERITGLNTTMAGGLLGAAVLSTSGMGRAMMGWLAKRLPAVGAALLIDDIISGLSGDKSYIGSLEGGQAALDSLKVAWAGLATSADSLASALERLFGFKPTGSNIFSDPEGFFGTELVKFIEDLKRLFLELAVIIEAVTRGDIGAALSVLTLSTPDLEKVLENLRKPKGDAEPAAPVGEPTKADAAPSGGGDSWQKLFDILFMRNWPKDGETPAPDAQGVAPSSGKGDRLPGAPEPAQSRFGAGADTGTGALKAALDNYVANMQRAGASGQAAIQDNRVQTDARDQSTTVSVGGVQVNVASPAAAPAAVGAAVGQAVGNAAADSAQIQSEPTGW